MTTSHRTWMFAALWSLLLAGAAPLPGTARGDEPSAVCPQCRATELGIPVLSKIPYVSRLFKKVPASQDAQRIGVDFDLDVKACAECPTGTAQVCQAHRTPQVLRWFVVQRHTQGPVLAACCAKAPCCDEGACCEKSAGCQDIACCQERGCQECCADACCKTKKADGVSWEDAAELYAKNAALEARLDALSEFHNEKSKMLEALADLSIEKARLEVQVEATKELVQLASENARLKAQVETAEERLGLVQEMARVAAENQQLKLALQARHGGGQFTGDVEYFPPTPEARPAREAAAPKKASFHQVEPAPRHTNVEPSR